MAKRLNHRQRRFIAEYLVCLNATEAAIRAGYSAKSAHSVGPAMLDRPDIAGALEQARISLMVRTDITQDRVLNELGLLAFSDVTHYDVDETTGAVKAAEGAPPGAMRAVSSIKRKIRIDKDGNVEREVELKLWDKPGPLKLAGRHVGLFPSKDKEQIEAQAKALLDAMIEDARKRREASAAAKSPQQPEVAMTVIPPGGEQT